MNRQIKLQMVRNTSDDTSGDSITQILRQALDIVASGTSDDVTKQVSVKQILDWHSNYCNVELESQRMHYDLRLKELEAEESERRKNLELKNKDLKMKEAELANQDKIHEREAGLTT